MVFPLLLVVLQSFQSRPGPAGGLRAGRLRAALGEPGFGRRSHTLSVTFVRQLLSLPLAVLVAWLLARTDLPVARGSSRLLAAFFLPPSP